MNDNKRKLYDALSNDYDMGTYEQFRKDLEDKDKRRKLYDATSEAYDFGDYDQFEAQLGYSQSPSAPGAEEISSGSAGPVMPKPAMENRNWDVQMGNGHSGATVERPEPVDVPVPQRPEGQDTSDEGTAAPSGDVRSYLEYANRQQVANLSRDISSRLDEAQTKSRDIYMTEQEDARKGGFLSTLAHAIAASGHNPEGRSGGMSDAQQRTLQGADSELQSEISKLEAAKKAMSNAEEIIAEADKSVQERKFPGFIKGIARGFGDKLFDVNTWDMGVSDTKNSIELLKALRKYDEGEPLSESEQMLLDAKSVELATNAYFGSYIGRGYKAGSVTAQSLPFMLEMAVNPASTLGKSTQSMLARYALSRFAKKGATRAAQKFATKAAGAAGRALGDIAGSAVMAGTSGAVRVAGDAIDRHVGDIETDMDGQGQTVFAGHDTESLGKSIAKAFASTAIENHSEMLGEYFAPALGIVSKLGRKGMEKFGLKNVVDFVDDVSATDAAKLIADFQKRTKWHGTIGEYAEEVTGNIENAILVGDNTLDASDDTGVFNLDQNIDTFLGVALMGGVFSTARTIGWRTPKYRARMEMEKARNKARTKYGSEAWQEIEDRMAEAGDSGMSAVLSTVIAGENSPEKAKALLDYAKSIKKYEGMLAGDEKRREIASPEATDLETSYENGYTLSTPQEVHDAKLMFEYQEAMLQKALGTSDIDIDTIMLGNEMGTLTDEQKSVVMDYLNAKATFDGVIDRVRDDLDSRISSVENAIDASTNRDTGMLQPASLVDDRPVHIISGIVRLTPDGTMVDTRNSENFIIVRDDRTGRMETISPSDINRLENEIDPAMEKQAARQQIQDVYGSREADSIDGVLAFNPGDTYTLTNGQGQSFPVQIVENEQGSTDNGDGTVNVILNNDIDPQTGQPRITQMPKEQIQEMAEATNLSRLQQYEQQKLARAAEQAETDATGRTPENPFRINDRITLSDAETGNVENGVVGSELTDDGKYEVVVEKQDGSQSILYLSPSELEQLGARLEQPDAVEEQNSPVLEQNQPVLEQKTAKTEQESAMSRIPLDRDGVPQFEQAQPSDTWEALLELNGGNAVEAEDTARQMYENASKNLDKAQKTKPKSGTSVMEIQRNKAERNGQIDELRKSVDFWGKVLSFPEAVRKSESAAAEAAAQQKEDAKREAARQAKENLAKGRKLMQQKGTYYKDDAKLGDYLDFHDYALRMIANGRVKFVWKNDADNNSIKGLGGHLGLADSESERKALFSLLANPDKGGLRPDDAAEQLSEEYNSSLGAEVISSSEALDVILDIIRTYGGKTRDMMNAAIDAHANVNTDRRDFDSFDEHDASELVTSMSANAEPIPNEELTPENWNKEFGDRGEVETPVGVVKMGENQLAKLFMKGRANEFGMIKPTLNNPDVIVEEYSTTKNDDAERESSYLFVKTFDRDGEKIKFFTSVTVRKDGLEVVISNHFVEKKALVKKITEGNVIYIKEALSSNSSEKHLAENQNDLPDLLPTQENNASSEEDNMSSEGKDTNISEESNTGSEKSVAEQITEQREVVNTEPTEAQKEAGNYRMGHVKIDGMDVTIENPKGSIRRGTDADGKKWESEMHYDYGYIRGTKAVDNDHIDIFLSDNPETGNVFVVDQVNPKTGEFDESKVMYGFASEQEARDAYLSNYEKGWKGLGKITEVTREEFKKWIDSSTRKTKPFSEYASVKTAEAQKEKGSSTEVSDNSKNNTSDKASERGFILMDDFIKSALQEAYENRTDKSLSRDDWNEEDEAIDAENKANDDYYQYIESLSNSGELQKMYDASSIGEQIKMRKSIGEAGHEFKDLIDTTKAADVRKEAREKKKKEEYRLKMKNLGIDIEDDDVQPSTKKPEAQKEKPVQGLEGYSRDEIKNIVTDHINDVMRDYDIDAEIIGMDIHGSRNRHDARPDSDLDVVVEYSGDIREDDMFNALNGEEDALSIEGIRVDINPIRKEETGDLQDYMKQSEEYDKEKSEHANVKPLDGNAQKNIIVDAFREWNGNLRNKYRSSPQFSELDNAISIAKYQADEGNVKPDAQKNFEKAVRLIPELYFGSGDIQFSIGKKNYETTSSGVKDFAEKYGVSQEAVEDYANGMRLGTGAGCGLALLNIRRDFRLANSTLKFAEFSHEYAKLKQELFDKFGDYEKLKAQQIAEADARRDTMEAARKRIEEEQQRKKAEYEARIARYKGMSLEELDSEYFKALENNDEVSARDIVDEVARRNGYADVTSDYQGAGAWAAPSRPGGYTDEERRASLETDSPDLSLEDISLGYTMQPDDIFDHPERYMQSDSTSKEAARAIKATLNALKKGNKDAKIKVFRAVPLSVKEGRLRNGDWVTPSRAYADMHGNHRLEGEYRVIEEEVPAKDLWWDGNDVREWGYDDGTARRYANVENNTKLNDVITKDDAGNIIPPSRRFDSDNADERYQISGRKAIDEGSEESRIAYEAVKEQFDRIGIPVELLSDQAMREMAINATMLDTALPEDESSFKGTVISSIDGAKILNNLDKAIDRYNENPDNRPSTFIGDLASALGSSDKDKSSQYATFETKNGQVVTIRVSNHNATVSNFDNVGESNGISIVISRKPNEGITNDGDAHIVEFFYPDKALNKADGKPLVEILKSIKQSLYSGEYKDTTGLAQREEVNAKESVEFLRVPDGTVYGATVGGKIYLNQEHLNPNTPIHEYTHLWFSALEKANPELYKRGVELMRQLPVWEEVKTDPNYANLSGDDAIASECLSRLVGDKGADKLTELAKKAMVRGDIIGTANRISLIEEFKDWLKKFWTWVRDSFAPWTKEEASRVSVDDIQNMVLSDLAKGVNPLANAREESELKKTNDKFNEQLETFTIETADRYNFNLGRPSSVLLSAGIENKPIRLHGSKVAKKIRKHGFQATALRDLPKAIAHPIAVFDNLGREGNRSILTELKMDNGNVLVSIDLGRGTEVDFNIVSSAFGKKSKGILGWINGGKMRFVDKEKALNYLHLSAPIAEASDNAELLSAANIVKEFENPSGKERKPEFQFIGEKGAAHMDKVEEASIRLDNLSIARQMEDADKDAKTIKLATGWERGADGKWRYEISDANIKDTIDLGKGISKKRFEGDMLWNSGRLGNVVEAPEIFKAYPQLKDVHIETDSIVNDMPSNGEYNANSNRITIHADRLKYLNSILNHEIQHAIQHIEGFATGGTPEHLEKEFNAAKTEWRARAYAHELEETAKELGGEYNLAEVENALGKEYKELGMEALLPDKETRIKGANYFARGYADRNMDEAIRRFRLDESAGSDFNSYVEYMHIAGEVEARNVSARLGMTPDERRRTLALETEDVSREDQIILNDALNGDSHYEEEPEIDRIVREAKENGTYMKAPNGKPTNLDERQWAQVRTGAFKKWFGDWEKAAEESLSAAKTNSSKIVDENGEPKVVYHGSPYRFFRFDKARLGQSTGADSAKEGFFFTDNKDLAELFSRYSLEKLPVSDVEQLVKDRLQNMSREELNEAYEAYRNDSPDYQDYADEAGSPSDREYLEMSGFLRDGISEDEAKRNYVQDSIENKIEGGYFSDMEEIEEELSSIGIEFGNNEQVFLNIKSPITDDIERDYFHNGEDVSPMTPVLQEAKRMGHDGVVFTGVVENGQKGAANQYVAFEPGQIKSATDNVGTFDGEQDDIRYRDSGQTDAEYMSAIESGDMRKAGRMVEAAFRKAFPGSKVKNVVYHGVAVSEDGRQFSYNSIREGHFTDDEGFAEYYAGPDGYVYKVFLDIESPLEQDFRGQNSDFARDAEGNDVSTRTFARRAKESNGRYDGAIISNVDEYGDGIEADGAGNYDGSVTDYIPVSADQIYSAEPVVYDDNGQVVPLSKRFVAGNPDIRYKQDGAVNGSRTSQDVEAAAARLAESLGEKVRIVRDVNEIENRNKKVQESQRRSKGWFNTGTGEIVVVLPNATGIEDVQATILHEAVGHKGLRELVGEDRFDDFLDNVYAAATKATRLEIVSLARRNHWDFRLATEEYIAGLAEKGFSGRENRTLFGKIKDFFLDMLSRAKIALGFNIGDNELRYMLWRTYQMRTSRGILAKANDMAVQQELKVGNFREDQLRGRNGFTVNDIAEMKTPILESRGTFAKLADAEKWAKENLQGKTFVNSFTGDEINISGHSIKEMLAPKFSKAINEKTHMAAIMSVPDFIETGIPAEIHKDTHGRGYDVMRLYNAIVIDGEPYRVKSTVKRYVDGDRYYTYEIQEMELLKGTQTTALGLDDSSRPQLQSSITGANLLKGVKKTNSDEEILSGEDSGLRFRTSGNGGSSNTARDIYEEKTRVIDRNGRKSDTANLMRRLKEAYVDSMQSLKYLQDAISEETGKPVEDFENAYLAENSMSSKNKAQTDIYLNRFFNPIKDAIRDLQKEGAEYGDIVRYLMAKHGLERNEVFSKRDAEKDGGVWDGSVRRDYSGLTELTRRDTDTVAPRIDEITSRAEDIVRNFEMDHDTDVLWEKINAATKDTLRTSYITGMLTKDNYEMIRSMFRYYIPLRGWSENMASAVYDYLSDARPKTSSIVKAATGRTTISDDPIATIAYMGQSAIIQGNRNLMKQKLLNLALNHKTGLLTVSRQWEVLDPVTGMWTPRDPAIPADAAPEQVADIVADFEKDMKEAEKKGVARLSRGKLDTGKHLNAYEGQEHIIKVKRGGIDYSIYLNGNPRAAQAVNGMTNPDAVDSWLIRKARVIKNFMARMFTSQNPAFIISNLSLDVIFAGTAVYAKEDAKYAARYAKNITAALAKGQLIGLIHRFETDRLDNSKDLDRYFGEFIRNGGETGFTQLNTVDDFKRDIDRFAREMKQGQVMKVSTKVWNGIWDGIEYMNRCAEDATRFSVYMTSRQMGRSVERSISDAKEITVNFNRKGSGGFGARLMNFAYIFFNAAVQSLANAGKILYEHPMKALAALGTFSAAGFMAPLLAQAIISAFGGDDDAYWDLPEWVRRNNFVFYIPWSDNKFLIIPISQELRPFYAMGEIAMSVLMGKEEVLDGLKSAAGSFMDLLPIDFMGNGGNLAISLTPTVAQPFAQLVANTDYFGSPIYRRNDYNKLDPAWTKAYKDTSPMLVNASKWLNEVTGGDDVKRGWIDPVNNPAVIEHLFEGYLGGAGKTLNKAAKTFSMIWNPDMRDIRNIPIASTFIQESDDERVAGNQLNREYFKLMDEFRETSHTVSGYKKKARMGSMEYADKLNEFMETPDFERYSKARGYANTISKLRQALKKAQESGEDVMVEENLQQILHDLKRKMVEELKEQ